MLWTEFSNTLTSNAVWIWLFTAYDYAAVASSVHGFSLRPTNSTSLDSLSTATFS
jgi:ABC-type transport system substrate-binding protein